MAIKLTDVKIKGLERNAYYFLNPIFVTIEANEALLRAEVRLTNTSAIGANGSDLSSATFKLMASPDGKIRFDLAEYVKSVAVYPNGYRAKRVYPGVYTLNNINISFKISSNSGNVSLLMSKQFVLGYSDTDSTNVYVIDLNLDTEDFTLKDLSIPFYRNVSMNEILNMLSRERFRINGNAIEAYHLEESEMNILNDVYLKSCDFAVFRFLNSKGGYNYIVSGDYSYTTKSEVTDNDVTIRDFFNQRVSKIGKKVNFEKEYTAKFELPKKFNAFVDEFIRSGHVEVAFEQDLSDITFFEIDIQENTTPQVNGNSISFDYSFKLITSTNI